MRTRQPTTTTLENLRIPVQAKLAAAWTSFMFLCVYVDIIAFFKPGTIDEILVGKIWEFDISQTLLTTFLALMAIPIFMVVLSMTLPARANRITNLIVASVQVPYTAFNMAGESWTYFYGLGFALEVIVLALILRSAWTWPPHRTAGDHGRPARTVKPFAPSSKREPKSSPSPVRSHLPRCRGVGLLAVGHQLPLVRRVGAFQGPYRQVRSSDAHTGPPHRRHRPQARQRRRPPHRPATTGTPSRRIRSASPHRSPRKVPVMIEAHELTKRYGDKTAVHTLSFTIAPGTVTGFLGPNGAGKSTTMRLIMGLDRPTSGTVTVNGKPYGQHRSPLREVGALLDAKAVHPGRSARSHLRTMAATHNIKTSRVSEVIEMTGLAGAATKRVGGFSLGMSQRLGIAAALLGDPERSSSTSRSTGSTPRACSGLASWCATWPPRDGPCSCPRT